MVAFGVGKGKREGVGDLAGFFEGGDDVGDEVLGSGLGGVRKDDVGIATLSFTTAIAAYDDALKSRVGYSAGLHANSIGNSLDF